MGSPIGMRTDGGSSNALDLFESGRLLKSATQARYGLPINDATVLPVEDVLRMWTTGGARALMLQDRIGTLEVGKRADIVLVDHRAPHMQPTHNLQRTLVVCTHPQDVSDVIVDGVVLMRERRLTQADEGEILLKATQHLKSVAARAGF
jgi:5-methylthioadenosine/S-adenosylhomocysteine deaminase